MDGIYWRLDWADVEAISPTDGVFVVELGDAQVEGLVKYLQWVQRLPWDRDPTGHDEVIPDCRESLVAGAPEDLIVLAHVVEVGNAVGMEAEGA